MASTKATVCFRPCARRKSGTAASSACRERIAPGFRGASSGPAGGATSGGSGIGFESGSRASGLGGVTKISFGLPRGPVHRPSERENPLVPPGPVQPAALCMVPGKSSGSQDVSARSALWPCASSQSPASRRVIPARKREARFGNTPGSGSARNRVLVAIIPGRGPQAGESRDSGARPSGRPGAGAPPASPGGPRPRTARTLRELPGEPGAPPCDCGSTCRERRACCAGTSEKAADDPANGRARATRGCPTSRKIKRIQRGMLLSQERQHLTQRANTDRT